MKHEKLHNITSTGFKTPDNYFEALGDDIFSKIAEDTLSSRVNSSGFEVPKDYFETFDNKILTALNTKNDSKVISIFGWKKVAYISGIAASFILAFNLLFSNSNDLTFDALETASIENYLLNEDLSAYDMAPYLGISDFDSDNFVEHTMNASDIEDYLIQNSDLEQLITD